MKSVFAFVMLAVSVAFACPGGHLKTFAVKKKGKDVVWAEVDMVSSTIKAGKDSTITEVLWQAANAETMEVICGLSADGDKGCGTDVGLNFKLLENMNGTLTVAVQQGRTVKRFKATRFAQSRGIGSCGAVIYPEKK